MAQDAGELERVEAVPGPAKVFHPSEVASAWMMSTGIIDSVATSTTGSNGVLTLWVPRTGLRPRGGS